VRGNKGKKNKPHQIFQYKKNITKESNQETLQRAGQKLYSDGKWLINEKPCGELFDPLNWTLQY